MKTARYVGLGLYGGPRSCCLCGLEIEDKWPQAATTIIYHAQGDRVFAHAECAGVEFEVRKDKYGKEFLGMVELPKEVRLT